MTQDRPEVADDAVEGARRLGRADERMLQAVTSAGGSAQDAVMPRVSAMADRLVLWWLIAGTLAVAGDRRLRLAALRAVLAMAVAGPVSNGVGKYVFRRDRPPAPLRRRRPGRVPDSPGFPSGHSAAAAAFATTLVYEAPAGIGIPVASLASLVAYSRIYTGAHYPGDVAAGAVTGIAIAVGLRRLTRAGTVLKLVRKAM
jgi:membrane-associated phospholipid phosphatase